MPFAELRTENCVYRGDVAYPHNKEWSMSPGERWLQDVWPHGFGEWWHNGNGHYFRGEYSHGERSGNGIYEWRREGCIYEGSFRNSNPNGNGVFRGPGFEYRGDFKEWFFDGRGVLRLDNGTSFDGEFARNIPRDGGLVDCEGHSFAVTFNERFFQEFESGKNRWREVWKYLDRDTALLSKTPLTPACPQAEQQPADRVVEQQQYVLDEHIDLSHALSPVPEQSRVGTEDNASAPATLPDSHNDSETLPANLDERAVINGLFNTETPSEVPMEVLVKWTNDFDAERAVGEGAFGEVFHGECDLEGDDETPARRMHVAVKRLRAALLREGEEEGLHAAVRTFRREIKVLSTFRHPNIVRLLGFSTPQHLPGQYCLVYPLVEAGALDCVLREDARAQQLSWIGRVRIAAGVARALNFLHCHDPCGPAFHRDVKSANIVLDDQQLPKLIDCGLAKYAPEPQRGSTLLTSATVLGTPGYICPTYQRTLKFDAKSELYSFGIVLLELLTGRLQGADDDDLFGIHIEDAQPVEGRLDKRAGAWNGEVVRKMESVARECLAPVRQRVGSMAPVMRRLMALEQELCRPTREEERLVGRLEELRMELEQLQGEAKPLVTQQACCGICFDSFQAKEGLHCAAATPPLPPLQCARHFVCAACAAQEVSRVLEALADDPQALASHRQLGGRISCVQPGCQHVYPETALAHVLCERDFARYRSAQDEVVEQRLFEQLQQRFQQEIATAQRSSQAATEAATAELLRRQYPNAVQCPQCQAGPVVPENCYNLAMHHGERTANGSGRISNACPACGFFSSDRGDWHRWDGRMR